MSSFGNFIRARIKDVGQTLTSIYTAPTGVTSYALQIDIANTADTGVQVDVAIFDGSDTYYIIKNAPIPVGATLEVVDGKKIVLAGDEILQVRCATTGEVVDVSSSWVEDVNA